MDQSHQMHKKVTLLMSRKRSEFFGNTTLLYIDEDLDSRER